LSSADISGKTAAVRRKRKGKWGQKDGRIYFAIFILAAAASQK
jgi:hypothetical protein